MIWLSDNDRTIKVQRLRNDNYIGEYYLTLQNLYVHTSMTVEVEDEGDDYTMSFEIPAETVARMNSGEYVYTIQDANLRIVTSGVARKKETRYPADAVYSNVGGDIEYTGLFAAKVRSNEIWYRTTDGQVISFNSHTQGMGFLDIDGNRLNVVSNTYSDGKGVIKLSGDLYQIVDISNYGIFEGCQTLQYIGLPKNWHGSGRYTFSYCRGLEAVDYYGTIADWCDIDFAPTPGSNPLNYAHNLYIKGEHIIDLVIPEGVTTIKRYAFNGIALNSVTLPATLQQSNTYAFNTDTISETHYNGTVDQWAMIDFTANTKSNPTAVSGNLYIGGEALQTINITTATEVKKYTFQNVRDISSVTVGPSVQSIGTLAFNGVGANEVHIADSVSSIGTKAFASCTYLYYNGNATYISNDYFWGARVLNPVDIDGVWVYGDYAHTILLAYLGTGASSVTIPEGVQVIRTNTVYNQPEITEITLPTTLLEIENYGLECTNTNYNISLVNFLSANVPSMVTNSIYNALAARGEITYPEGSDYDNVYQYLPVKWGKYNKIEYTTTDGRSVTPTTSAGWGAAYYSTEYYNGTGIIWFARGTMPTSMPNGAFYVKSTLETVTIPASITSIGDNAFDSCSSLNEITSESAVAPTLGNDVFYNIAPVGTLNYPEGSDYSTWYAQLPEGWQPVQVPQQLNEIRYTTTDGQPDTSWVEAYDTDGNQMQPNQDSRYGKIFYDYPVYRVVFYGNDTLSSVELPVLCKYFQDGDDVAFTNCKRLVVNTYEVFDSSIYKFTAVEYAEVWAIDGGMAGLEVWPHGGERVYKVRSEVYDNGWGSWLGDWTYEPLGTTVKYEASEQVTLNDCNALNRNTYLNVVSHTFSDGVGTITYDGTVGELRDGWSSLPITKLIVPDTLGYFDYLWDTVTFDIEFGKHAGLVGGSMYASGSEQRVLRCRYDCTINISFRPENLVMFVGNDGCVYRNDWYNGTPYVRGEEFVGQTIVDNAIEYVMDERCDYAEDLMLNWYSSCNHISRFVVAPNCIGVVLRDREGWMFTTNYTEIVVNDNLQLIRLDGCNGGYFVGGTNNPYLNVHQYYVESADGQTLYYACNGQVDLSNYTTFESYSVANKSFSTMPDISSCVTLHEYAFYNVHCSFSTWTWPDSFEGFNGNGCFMSNDIDTLVFGPNVSYTWGCDGIECNNCHTIIFNTVTAPSLDCGSALNVASNGDIWFPVNNSSSWDDYITRSDDLKSWTKHYIMDNNKFAIKTVSGNAYTNQVAITGLTYQTYEYSDGWTVLVYDNNIVNFDTQSLVNDSDIERVVLPDTVTTLGFACFDHLANLTSVYMPSTLTYIGVSAFSYCTSLERLTIPNNVTTVGTIAFEGCTSLKEVVFGSSVSQIGCFSSSGLFDGCVSLEKLKFTNPQGTTLGSPIGSNVPATGDLFIPNGTASNYSTVINALPGWSVIDQGNNQLYYTSTDGQVIDFSGTVVSNTYTNGLGVVTFDRDLTEIGGWYHTNDNRLLSLQFPPTIEYIRDSAFESCSSLASVKFLNSFYTLHGQAFKGCPIANQVLWLDIDYIGYENFDTSSCAVIKFGGEKTRFLEWNIFDIANTTDIFYYGDGNGLEAPWGNPFFNDPGSGTLHLKQGVDPTFWTDRLNGWTVVYDA